MTLGNFSRQAEAYRRARPGYPASLVDRLIAEASVAAGDPVVEFGAGTGIFTRLLVARGLRVTSVEPNRDMIRQADLPDVQWVEGTFEEYALCDGSQAWAVAAQAFHWATPEIALPRIRRTLKSGGVFTVLWNDRENESSEVLAWTAAAIRRHVPDFDEAYRHCSWGDVLESTGDFKLLSHHAERHTVAMSRERYLDLWRSHNRLNYTAGPERFNALINELTAELDAQAIETVDVPYRCEAWSCRRND